jgi:repressor LexA
VIKETFGSRLKQLRTEHDLSQEAVAAYLNQKLPGEKTTKSKISKYETGRHSPRNFSIVPELADFFGVTTDYLSCRVNNRYEKIGGYECKELKILGTIAAGIPILAQEDIQGYEYVPKDFHADFCLKVKGDSMINARILDGDIVYIRKQPEVENGEIAAVIVDNDEATLKRVYKRNGNITLRPENPMHEEKTYKKKDGVKITILGKAVFFKSEVR